MELRELSIYLLLVIMAPFILNSQISVFKKGAANVEKIATTGVDGKLVIWKV